MPKPTRSTIFHEAGHAVAAAVLGIETETVSVEPLEDAVGYHMLTGTEIDRLEAAREVSSGMLPKEGVAVPSFHDAQAVLRAHLTMVLAGEVAQRRAVPTSYRHHHVELGDHRQAVELILCLASGPDELMTLGPAVGEGAARLLDEHWQAVEAVAEALRDKRTLTGVQVRQIVATAT